MDKQKNQTLTDNDPLAPLAALAENDTLGTSLFYMCSYLRNKQRIPSLFN